jgi:hypothetical protein
VGFSGILGFVCLCPFPSEMVDETETKTRSGCESNRLGSRTI